MQSGVGKPTFDSTEVLERIRRQWLSNLAHDFSGPLFTARGYIRMTLQAPENHLSGDHKRYLTLALENIERLAALARAIEDFPPAGGFEFQSFDLRGVLAEAIAGIGPLLQAKSARLRQDSRDVPLTTTGDRGKIAQALGGFLTAIAGAARPGSELEITSAEADGLIATELTAAIEPAATLDLSLPSRLWQSHGGSTSAHHTDSQYSLTCELPVIRLK